MLLKTPSIHQQNSTIDTEPIINAYNTHIYMRSIKFIDMSTTSTEWCNIEDDMIIPTNKKPLDVSPTKRKDKKQFWLCSTVCCCLNLVVIWCLSYYSSRSAPFWDWGVVVLLSSGRFCNYNGWPMQLLYSSPNFQFDFNKYLEFQSFVLNLWSLHNR